MIQNTSFYEEEELHTLNFGHVGKNVKISRKTSFYNPQNMFLGDHVRIDDFCVFSAGKKITLGNYIHIACFCALYASEPIVIDDFSTLSSRVVIYTCSDDYSGRSLTNPTVPDEFCPHITYAPVTLKKHVVVGTNSTILPNVTIGSGTAIGAHSLVNKSLDDWGIYAGTPVKFLKTRKKDLLALEQAFVNASDKSS